MDSGFVFNFPKEEDNPLELDWSSLLQDPETSSLDLAHFNPQDSIFQTSDQLVDLSSSDFFSIFDLDNFPTQTPLIVEDGDGRTSNNKRICCNLEYEEIQKYFHVPISRAAKELKVGLTVLKRRCREVNILRWPHRKMKSLESLMKNLQEMGLTEELARLEQHKQLLGLFPDMEFTDRTKKLRQACFKANYKKRRASLHE